MKKNGKNEGRKTPNGTVRTQTTRGKKRRCVTGAGVAGKRPPNRGIKRIVCPKCRRSERKLNLKRRENEQVEGRVNRNRKPTKTRRRRKMWRKGHTTAKERRKKTSRTERSGNGQTDTRKKRKKTE